MLTNNNPREGFKPNLNYVRKKGRAPVVYYWTTDPVGRTAIYFIQRIAESMLAENAALSAVLIERSFKENGFRVQPLFSEFIRRCPEFMAHYAPLAKRPLTADNVRQRAYMGLFYTNGKKGRRGQPFRGQEHYTASKRLRPRVEKMERLFMTKLPVTIEQMMEAGR